MPSHRVLSSCCCCQAGSRARARAEGGGQWFLRGVCWGLALASALVLGSGTLSAQEEGKPAEEPAGAAKPELPEGVYARVDGRDITEKEYAEFLLSSVGKAQLGKYIDRLLLEASARRQGVVVTREEVESLVDERIERTIQGLYRGDREAFLGALAERHMSLADRRQKDRQEIFFERLLEKLVLKERKVTPEAKRREFERAYGVGGVQYEIRQILVSTGRRIGPGGESLPARTEAEARERASKIRRELLDGADFGQLVKRYSDDSFTRANDGRVPLYRPDFFGVEFHRAVEGLTKEAPLSGVVPSRRGFHLVQLLEKRLSKFQDVEEEVEKLVRNRPPTLEEKRALLAELRKRADIQR